MEMLSVEAISFPAKEKMVSLMRDLRQEYVGKTP